MRLARGQDGPGLHGRRRDAADLARRLEYIELAWCPVHGDVLPGDAVRAGGMEG